MSGLGNDEKNGKHPRQKTACLKGTLSYSC